MHDLIAEPSPLSILGGWLTEARETNAPEPDAVAFVTVAADGRPSARTVLLKRLEDDALVFTSALWTRKARELQANPSVSLLFWWPTLGRQVHVAGEAREAERTLARELFGERPLGHRVQTLVSRQGQPIEDLQPLRDRHAHLMRAMEAPPECPEDWGAIRVVPQAIEFWEQAPDRMHERLLYERNGDGWQRDGGGWRVTRLAP